MENYNDDTANELLKRAKEKTQRFAGKPKPSIELDNKTGSITPDNENNTETNNIKAGLEAEVATRRITTKEEAEAYIKAHGGELLSEDEAKKAKDTFYPQNFANAEMEEAFNLWKNAKSDQEFNNTMASMQPEKGHYASDVVDAAKIRSMFKNAEPSLSQEVFGGDYTTMTDEALLEAFYNNIKNQRSGSTLSIAAAEYDRNKGQIRMLTPVMGHLSD